MDQVPTVCSSITHYHVGHLIRILEMLNLHQLAFCCCKRSAQQMLHCRNRPASAAVISVIAEWNLTPKSAGRTMVCLDQRLYKYIL
jgi:hypothetical protein